MFNFGWGELVLIGIVALIAIGPKELPTVLRTLGQTIAKVRRMANEFQGQFQEALREADIADLKKQADDLTSSFKDEVTDISAFDPMSETLAETQKELEQSLSLDEPAKPSETPAVDYSALPTAEQLSPHAAPAEPVSAQASQIDVPLPDMPAPLTEKDFAAAPAGTEVADAAPSQGEKAGKAGGEA
ncbi:MAG: twin-arginine translocase subunit TatB [Rhodopseudomonas sp.]|nr:twin-arginine translocase subunit TatB [Rhodopseudomonas sp.]